MTTLYPLSDLARFSPSKGRAELLRDVLNGLHTRPRTLKAWMLYDELGSRIFERITELAEYYPTRTEYSLLEHHADEIVSSACDCSRPLRIVELGAGTAQKACILLAAAARQRIDVVYMPLDVSPDALNTACKRIESTFPRVLIEPVVANYIDSPPQLEEFDGTTVALYLGSSIGNFSPAESRAILRNLASQLRGDDGLLLGTDLVKDRATLTAAYDDREGVTAAFNLNILRRINRELDADFDLSKFMHRVHWNHADSRIEMYLESTCDQKVEIAGADLELYFTDGETIHTENSYKFTRQMLGELLSDSAFEMDRIWSDERSWYALTLSHLQRKQARDRDIQPFSPIPL